MQRWDECESIARRANAAAGGRNPWICVTLAVTLAAQNRMQEAGVALAGMRETAPHWDFNFVNGFLTDCQASDELMAPIKSILENLWAA